MQKVCIGALMMAGVLFVLISCGNSTIPIVIKNEYVNTLSEVIIGTEFVQNIAYGESKKTRAPINTVLITAYTASNEVIHGVFHLYLHNANNVITITKHKRVVLR